ncbi:glycine cleavage system protein GcvH [Solidesulfovibrio sp.]|uniref:glycine cleavage system protein GcvH n=1 Tax=Solidesulfovibrio sp. TaxID=2910990 RepID=UPI002605FC4B|nr:glycine cleavage system protein GcvH [Solidesulfovibrio sp.]
MQDSPEISLPDDRRYTTEHIWVMPDGGEVACGITDFAQYQLGEVVYVGLPALGAYFAAGESFGTVESMKSANELYMPVAGVVAGVNTVLEDLPDLVNAEPYADGWIIRVRPDAPDDAEDPELLLDQAGYRAFLRTLGQGK